MVGEVMDVIRAPANKIDKNTLVVFTSDNGAPMRPDGNLPLRGYKTQIWEVILAFNSNSLPLPELCLHIMAFRAASASLRSPGGRARSRRAAPPKPSVRRPVSVFLFFCFSVSYKNYQDCVFCVEGSICLRT